MRCSITYNDIFLSYMFKDIVGSLLGEHDPLPNPTVCLPDITSMQQVWT